MQVDIDRIIRIVFENDIFHKDLIYSLLDRCTYI